MIEFLQFGLESKSKLKRCRRRSDSSQFMNSELVLFDGFASILLTIQIGRMLSRGPVELYIVVRVVLRTDWLFD